MLNIREIDGNLVELRAEGKLTREDYELAIPRLEVLMAGRGKLNFLVELVDFKGWEAEALWQDIRFDLKHQQQIGKTAVVGHKTLEKWTTQLTDLIYPAPVKFFEDLELARAWLRGEGPLEDSEAAKLGARAVRAARD